MYYVNQEQIDQRLQFLPFLAQGCEQVIREWGASQTDLVQSFAQERILYLAIESVTDVGSLLIDAFMMRDASSYEDIVEILHGEKVFDDAVAAVLQELVQLRRPLTQDYTLLDRSNLHPLLNKLPSTFNVFADNVRAFIQKELAY
jgi:uncharacterized protein YutE (UPF0331/DUF86 family)